MTTTNVSPLMRPRNYTDDNATPPHDGGRTCLDVASGNAKRTTVRSDFNCTRAVEVQVVSLLFWYQFQLQFLRGDGAAVLYHLGENRKLQNVTGATGCQTTHAFSHVEQYCKVSLHPRHFAIKSLNDNNDVRNS